MNIVLDSSLWIEFLAGKQMDPSIMRAVRNKDGLIVPVICLYEVRKKFLNDNDSEKADLAVEIMKIGRVVEFDSDLAVLASDSGKKYKLHMADSIIYATARSRGAELYTQNTHFQGLEGAQCFPKAK